MALLCRGPLRYPLLVSESSPGNEGGKKKELWSATEAGEKRREEKKRKYALDVEALWSHKNARSPLEILDM